MTGGGEGEFGALLRIVGELTGDQSEISGIAKRWRALATGVGTHTGALKRAAGTVDDAWNGGAAENFIGYMARYPRAGTALGDALKSCAATLERAGSALETARGEVQAIYEEKQAWLAGQRERTGGAVPAELVASQAADALGRAEDSRRRAVEAVEAAVGALGGHLGTAFFTAIPAPGDQDFVPRNNPAMRWVPDPDFRQGRSTQLAGYDGSAPVDGGTGGSGGYGAGSGYGPGGGGGSGGTGYPGGSPGGPVTVPNLGANPRAKAIVGYALDQLGDRYVWGATGPNTFDCSGLTLRSYQAAGIGIPRVAADQWVHGPRVPDGEVQAGDLIFFDSTGDGKADHVGIVLDPERQTMIHAPNSRSVVRVESYGDYSTPRLGFTRPGAG
ncbi:cell wall-associated hydrolase (invasion-associated protein)-like protein [Planomonospora sphaerica]|uniref:Cell wall-associated hydrolase (Invasion-associated protein)-like protein n=1 Tax=Planomonospora sphaerica TaxID=161355 RepID=A0A171CMD3_9ACTN|nr:NlpC/P60 family protein [Planomonospora sphaerica]GAT66932.1 cell wall-associated hydrolase (invasion-associated protein)-like protein [Planomonospora sphaerica]